MIATGWRVWFALLVLMQTAVTTGVAAERPNILFLFADDQRADTIAVHGNPHIDTPHLDALVNRGFSFRRNYTFGSNSGAVCVPSRAMLMTGKTWFRIDTRTMGDSVLLPEILGQQGYATFATGKWHNGEASCARGFQRARNIMFGGMSDHTQVPVQSRNADGTWSMTETASQFSTELFADTAIDFLKTHDRSHPFFCYVAFTAPHDPRQPPEEFRDRYARQPPPLPTNFAPQFPFDNGFVRGRDEVLAAWPRTESVIREQLADYYGLISHLDQQIGRVLAALEDSGQLNNTLVVYAADNGLALGSHGLLGKQSVFEHSLRTPLVISGPGVPRGQSSFAFTYLLDLFPTLCEVCGVAAPDDLDGHSLRPLWTGERQEVRDSVFLPYLGVQRAVRDRRWKLIAYPDQNHLQLFDLERDPDERVNLAEQPEQEATLIRLKSLMTRWQTQVGDQVTIPETNQPPLPIDLTAEPRQPDPWQPAWIIEKYFPAP
ncbi:MAG: sulfatase-like hydrolase/transferase [Planctomycetaceae bacterium]